MSVRRTTVSHRRLSSHRNLPRYSTLVSIPFHSITICYRLRDLKFVRSLSSLNIILITVLGRGERIGPHVDFVGI